MTDTDETEEFVAVPEHLLADEPNAYYAKDLPAGLALWVVPMVVTTRIMIGVPGSGGVDDAWCYHTPGGAILAALAWDPETEKEPTGWHRHPHSGRRRTNGDPDQEYIAP